MATNSPGVTAKLTLRRAGTSSLPDRCNFAEVLGEDDGSGVGSRIRSGRQRGRMRGHGDVLKSIVNEAEMKATELLLLGLAGWTAIGVCWDCGLVVARRADAGPAWNAWIIGVWVVYLCVLIGVSLGQQQRVVAIGEPQCFDDMCFTVTGVEEMPGFLIQDGRRLMRVTIRVTNRGRRGAARRVYLGLSGRCEGTRLGTVAGSERRGLTARLAGGDSVVSEPIFEVAADATGLGLVLTHGQSQPGVLVIGDSDSLFHKKTVVALGR